MEGVRSVRLALAGCGVVGGELVRALRSRVDDRERSVRIELASVLVRSERKQRAPDFAGLPFTTDLDAFLSTDADIVVEAIGGVEPALAIARSTLERGAAFVTANKAVVADSGAELVALATLRGGLVRFEAAVAAGVPVIRTLREYLAGRNVLRVRGIVNGTCNFVLTLLEEGASLPEAVREAQRRGFAEADPSRDLDGRDAADKIAILAWLAFGVSPREVHVVRRGLMPHAARLVRGAGAVGGRLRLIAGCTATRSGVRASVEPVVVRADSPFGRTVGEENRIAIDAGWPWPLELAGPGAGGVPTAAALLADVLAAAASGRAARSSPIARIGSTDMLPERAPDRWLAGVRAGSLREVRSAIGAAGIATEPVGANGGDGWLLVGPTDRATIEPLLLAPSLAHADAALARLEIPLLSTSSAARTAEAVAAVAVAP